MQFSKPRAIFGGMEKIESDLLTVTEAAKLLRVTPVTVRTWYREGILRGFQVGKNYNITIGRAGVEALRRKAGVSK